MNIVNVSVPGKLMIMGEHAVVYGKPCIVTAVESRMEVTAEMLDEQIFKLTASDIKIDNYQKDLSEVGKGEMLKDAKFAEIALLNFMNKYKNQNGIKITTKSAFSSRLGFGFSAAVTVGMIKAVAELFNLKLSNKELFNLSHKTILDVQGKGSGFDAAASIYGGTLYFKMSGSVIERLKVTPCSTARCHLERQEEELKLIVGYSGVKADTVTMVDSVAQKMKNYHAGIAKIFDNIEKLVDEAKQAILDKDWPRLGTLMDYNQNYLEDLGVSTDKLNLMIEAAKKGGAYGAKLSGAGGGDCMIALVSSETKEQVKEAIKNVGGEIIDININAEGVKIESNS